MYSPTGYHHMTGDGFPHSDIRGSTPACGSPRLIAANHVLLRLLTPRHPPSALSSLTTNLSQTGARAPIHLRGQGQGSLFERMHCISIAPLSRRVASTNLARCRKTTFYLRALDSCLVLLFGCQ